MRKKATRERERIVGMLTPAGEAGHGHRDATREPPAQAGSRLGVAGHSRAGSASGRADAGFAWALARTRWGLSSATMPGRGLREADLQGCLSEPGADRRALRPECRLLRALRLRGGSGSAVSGSLRGGRGSKCRGARSGVRADEAPLTASARDPENRRGRGRRVPQGAISRRVWRSDPTVSASPRSRGQASEEPLTDLGEPEARIAGSDENGRPAGTATFRVSASASPDARSRRPA